MSMEQNSVETNNAIDQIKLIDFCAQPVQNCIIDEIRKKTELFISERSLFRRLHIN